MSVKVFFGDEIRRFPLSSQPSFDWLQAKVKSCYENLDVKRVKIFWTDRDGDKIRVGNNEDLVEALRNRKDELLRLHLSCISDAQTKDHEPDIERLTLEEFVDQTTKPEEVEKPKEEQKLAAEKPVRDPELHRGVVCDNCDGVVRGRRYKCVVCQDFDLCIDCEAKNVHTEHGMLRVTNFTDPSWKPWLCQARCSRRARFQHKAGPFSGERYLTTVGELLKGALRHAGVDIDYEIRPSKEEESKQQQQKQAAEQPKTQNGQTEEPKMEEEVKRVEIMEHDQPLAAPVEQTTQDWEMVDKNVTGGNQQENGTPNTQLYPEMSAASVSNSHLNLDKRVEEALAQMLAMGFNNDYDWLRCMLYRKNADIPCVLDMIQPKFDQ